MTLASAIDSPPDWSQATTEICCPLCEYNLRGLTEPRCPECGFVFTWAELIQGRSEEHPYLFEHHPKRNVWSFWKTYWSDWQAAKFWMDVNPAQPVRLRRLMMFWCLSAMPIFVAALVPFVWNLVEVMRTPPVTFYFTIKVVQTISFTDQLRTAWYQTIGPRSPIPFGAIEVLLWPWLSLLFLLVFSQSMRMAKIKKRHVLRAIVYGCDYYLLMIPVILLCQLNGRLCDTVIFLALACGSVSLYRLYFAYSRYLRFHLPFVTVLTSQCLVFLIAVIVYLQTFTTY